MLCKNRITLIGFLGQHAETRSTPNGNVYTRFSLATSVSWRNKSSDDYKTRTEWHRVISWNKLGTWAGALQKGAYVEVEGELRYREFTPTESGAYAWRRSTLPRFWRWTAPRNNLIPKLSNRS
jgi:single-strand DNA-binding protein